MANPLAELFVYNGWANQAVLSACRALPELALDSPGLLGDVRSIRQKLLHLVGGQQTFVLRTSGRQHEGELNAASRWPGWDALIAVERETSAALVAIAAVLTDDREVVLPYAGQRPRFPLSFFLVHAASHGGQHRTEIVLALQSLGLPAPDLDAWNYAAFAGYGAE